MDEVLLLSSPVQKSSNPPAAEDQTTTKPKPPVFAVPKSPPKSPFKIPSPVKLPKRSPAKVSSSGGGGQTPEQLPRLNKLSRRQRISPRLLASEPKSPPLPPETPTSFTSVGPLGRVNRESRIVPPKPPSSTVTSVVGADVKQKHLSGDSPSTSRSGRPTRQSTQVPGTQEKKLKDALPESAKQSEEQVGGKKAADSSENCNKLHEAEVSNQENKAAETRLRSRQSGNNSGKDVTSDSGDRQRTSKSVDSKQAEDGVKEKGANRVTADTAVPSGSESNRKRKAGDVPHDVLEDDDNDVFEPNTRRFRTPGRKPGNFSKVGESKKSRTPRPSSAAKIVEPEPEQKLGEDVSSIGRPLRAQSHETKEKLAEEGDGSVISRAKRKRKLADVPEDLEPRKRLRSRVKPDADLMEEDNEIQFKMSPTKSSDEFRDGSPRRSKRAAAHVKQDDKKKRQSKAKEIIRQRKRERQEAIVKKMNRVQKPASDGDVASEHSAEKPNQESTLQVQDIDKVISEKAGLLTTSVLSNKNLTEHESTTVRAADAITMRERDPLSENLLAVFRSEGSVMDHNFAGFANDEISKTHESFLNLSASRVDLGMELKVEKAGLNVCCIPSSELDVDNKSESSHGSSVDLADMSKVFQSLENFPSEGSDWEAPINNYFDKFDEVVEDLKRRTSELQALTPKSHFDDEDNSMKENVARKDAGNQLKLSSSEGNIADGVAEMPSTAALEDVSTRRRSARILDKESIGESRTSDAAKLSKDTCENNAVPYVKSSGNLDCDTAAGTSGIFKAPFPSPKKKIRSPPPGTSRTFATSTPVRRKSSALADESGSPCIAIPASALTAEGAKEFIEENYVHDEYDTEVDFPYFSSPNRAGVLMSPVKHVVLNNGEIGKPSVKRKNRMSMTKEGFSYTITPPSKSDARKSLFRLNRSASLEISSPGSQQIQSPEHSAFDNTSQMNRSLSTPLSASSQNKSPFFTYYTGSQKKNKVGPYSMSNSNKKPNFSSSILKPSKKGLQTKRLSRKQKMAVNGK